MRKLIALTLTLCAFAAAQIQDIPSSTPANQAFVKVNENFTYTAARLVEYGTTLPATCPAPYVFFDTDAAAGQNLYYCTAANTWTPQSVGSGLMQIKLNGINVGSPRANLDIQPGTYMVSVPSDDGTNVDLPFDIDTAKVATRANVQGGTSVFCNDASGSAANYTCTLSPALASYTAGMVIPFRPQTSSAAGAITLNAGPGSINVKQLDGTTDPGAAALVAGRGYLLFYDGTAARVIAGLPSGGGGSGTVTSVGLSVPAELSVSGSPVTSSGTLAVTWAPQAANTYLAGPTSGGAATPTFRAPVAADVPTHSHTAADVTSGTMATARLGGGTANSATFLRGDQTWATPTGSMASDWMDPTKVFLRDDFLGGGTGTNPGFWSQLQWRSTGIATGSYGYMIGEPNHPGIFRLTTTATNDNWQLLALTGSGSSEAAIDPTDAVNGAQDHLFIVRPMDATARYAIGLLKGEFDMEEGIFLERDPVTDTNWMFVTSPGGATRTRTNSGVPFVATAWVKVRVLSDTVGGVKIRVNSTTSANITATLPDSKITPAIYIQTRSAATKSLDIDFYAGMSTITR